MVSVALAISVLLMVVLGVLAMRRRCCWSVSCQRVPAATAGAPLRPSRPPVRTIAARRRDSPSPSPATDTHQQFMASLGLEPAGVSTENVGK